MIVKYKVIYSSLSDYAWYVLTWVFKEIMVEEPFFTPKLLMDMITSVSPSPYLRNIPSLTSYNINLTLKEFHHRGKIIYHIISK